MQLSFNGVFKIDLAAVPRRLLDPPSFLPVAGPRGSAMYEMTSSDRARVHRFQTRTILTIGSEANCDTYQSHSLKLAIAVSNLPLSLHRHAVTN